MQCERCKNLGVETPPLAYETTTLVGGYKTNLCIACRNAWHRHVTQMAIYKSLVHDQLSYDVALARCCHDTSGAAEVDARAAMRGIQIHMDHLFLEGRVFCGDRS